MEQTNNFDNDVIDLRDILAILRKRYLVIVIITLAALVTSGILSYFVMAPVYETKAVMLVTMAAPEEPRYSYYREEGLERMVNDISRLPELTINTYVGQLRSEAVMEKVVKKLKLDQNGYTARSLLGMVSVAAVKETNLIEVRVAHTDPFLATKIANTLTGEFLDFISENNEQQMGKSVEFLREQATVTGEELKKAVDQINKLESEPRGVAMLDQLIAAKSKDLSSYESQLLQVNMEHQQLLAGKQQAEAQLKSVSPTINVVRETETGAVELSEINPVYTELKAMINAKTVEVAEKNAQVKSIRMIIAQLNDELKVLQGEIATKKNVLEMAKREAGRLEATDSLLRSKIDETKIGQSMRFGETSIALISPATIPTGPIKPNKQMNMAIAFVIGLMVSMGLAFLLHYLDNTVKTPKEAEDILGLPVLGQIPYYDPNKPEALKS